MIHLARVLERCAVILGVAALAGILVLIAGQVGARVLAGRPLPWPEELGRILFIYLVFIGAAEASVTRGHIAVDLVEVFGLGAGADRVLDLIRDVATIVVLGVVAYGAWTMIPVVHSMKLPATGLRTSLMVVPVFAGSVMMLVASAMNLVLHLQGGKVLMASRTAEVLERVD